MGAEVKVCGLEACAALFEHRPEAIKRAYLIREQVPEMARLLRWCAARRLPYRIIELDELTRVAETSRHDGVCVVARPKEPRSVADLYTYVGEHPGPMVVLLAEDLRNPNNVGALLRAGSFFGVPYLVLSSGSVKLTAAAMRTSEGAAERVEVADAPDERAVVAALRARGFAAVALSSHATLRLGSDPVPERALVLLGSENAGLSKKLASAADVRLAIPGVGNEESLNVAGAATILLWEHWRTWRLGDSRPAPPATSRRRPTAP